MNKETTLKPSDQLSCGGTECGGDAATVRPAYRVERRETGVTLHIALPGVARDDAKVAVEDSLLTVRAPRRNELPEGWETRQELRSPDEYLLRLRLHRELDSATTKAELRDGVLSLAIERHEETLPRTIQIT